MAYKLPKGSSGDAVLAGVEFLNNRGEAGREELHIACCEGSGLSKTMSEWLVSETSAQNCPVGFVWEKYPKNWGDGRRVGYKLTDFGKTLVGIYDPQGRRLKERLAKMASVSAVVGSLVRVKPRTGCYLFDAKNAQYGGYFREYRDYGTEEPRLGVVIGWTHYYIEESAAILFGPYVEGDAESYDQWTGASEPMVVVLMSGGERIITRMTAISIAKSGGKR